MPSVMLMRTDVGLRSHRRRCCAELNCTGAAWEALQPACDRLFFVAWQLRNVHLLWSAVLLCFDLMICVALHELCLCMRWIHCPAEPVVSVVPCCARFEVANQWLRVSSPVSAACWQSLSYSDCFCCILHEEAPRITVIQTEPLDVQPNASYED